MFCSVLFAVVFFTGHIQIGLGKKKILENFEKNNGKKNEEKKIMVMVKRMVKTCSWNNFENISLCIFRISYACTYTYT